MLGNGWNISKTREKIIVKHEKFFQHRKQKKNLFSSMVKSGRLGAETDRLKITELSIHRLKPLSHGGHHLRSRVRRTAY